MIAKAPRYAKTYEKAISGDIPAFAEEAKAAGYATDPRYPAKLAAYAQEPLFADLA
jgi:flagellum-specific peptidoglycan hydrolase FlgJ